MQYETIDFAVLEADSKEQAQTELDKWIKDWLHDKEAENKLTTSKDDSFMAELENSGEAFMKATSKTKGKMLTKDTI